MAKRAAMARRKINVPIGWRRERLIARRRINVTRMGEESGDGEKKD